jgi:monovalent cation:proton antiporter-2 (CPA2) family protein
MHTDALVIAFTYLLAAAVIVPLAKRLGLGAVLGYLLAGMLIGPYALNLVGDLQGEVMQASEYGVVMMLFVIGLELEPETLWRLRRSIFGLGLAQVMVTGVVLALACRAAGQGIGPSLVLGFTGALSSTAIVLQSLEERGQLKSQAGQASFSVLLFQDLAVIPLLALLPLLGSADVAQASGHAATGPAWLAPLKIIAAVTVVILAGRYGLNRAFKAVASTHLRESFTAVALAIVVGTAVLMQAVGLSPALGAFLAGVVLADSDYKHQLEADLEPFKGLLMGLFFVSVGAAFDFQLIRQQPWAVAGLTVGLVLLKGLVVLGLAKVIGFKKPSNYVLALALAQGGEFGFVVFAQAENFGALPGDLARLGSAAIALSMAVAPLLLAWGISLTMKETKIDEREPDAIDPEDHPVILAGFGRFGSVIGRFLRAQGVGVTILEADADQVDSLRMFGMKSFYGDASRLDLLYAAGAEKARMLIVAVDQWEKSLEIVDLARKHFPHLRILVRANHRLHEYEILDRGLLGHVHEMRESALALGVKALQALGMRHLQAHRASQIFRRHDDKAVRELAALRLQKMEQAEMALEVRRRNEVLESLLATDFKDFGRSEDRGWEHPQPE